MIDKQKPIDQIGNIYVFKNYDAHGNEYITLSRYNETYKKYYYLDITINEYQILRGN